MNNTKIIKRGSFVYLTERVNRDGEIYDSGTILKVLRTEKNHIFVRDIKGNRLNVNYNQIEVIWNV